jgi:hypothetical protein
VVEGAFAVPPRIVVGEDLMKNHIAEWRFILMEICIEANGRMVIVMAMG